MRDVSQYNAPHHEHIATHPHHKHVGAKILPAIELEFSQVIDEAVALIEETSHPASAGKKRRQSIPKKS